MGLLAADSDSTASACSARSSHGTGMAMLVLYRLSPLGAVQLGKDVVQRVVVKRRRGTGRAEPDLERRFRAVGGQLK